MKTSKISIITVSYNAVSEIEKTILSVINQNYSDIEYIIIDGGSIDGTIDVIKKYENKLSYWVSEPDRGIYDAMNKGIDVATGEWINFMNSGDFFYSYATIENMKDCFIKENDVVYGGVNMLDKRFSKIVQSNRTPSRSNPMPFNHQSVFVKRLLLQKYHFNLYFRYAADYHFFYTIFPFSRYCVFPGVIASYAIDGISSLNGIAVNRERIEINPSIYNYYKHVLYVRNSLVKKVLLWLGLNNFLNLLRKWMY